VPPIRIVRSPVALGELRALAQAGFGDFVKAVVDVERGVMAVGGELHADRAREPVAGRRGPGAPGADRGHGGRAAGLVTGRAAHHPALAAGGWRRLSLVEQLANVGSEVGRLRRWQGRDAGRAAGAFERALELLDLTLADPRWRDRLREVARAREVLCDAATGGHEYGTTLEALDRYFLAFGVAARVRRAGGGAA
jgi:hypothetical protein